MQEQNVSFVAFPRQSPTPLTRKRVQKGSHLVLVLIAVAAKASYGLSGGQYETYRQSAEHAW